MKFHSKLLQPVPEQKVRGWNGPLPFYMTYPGYFGPAQEAMLLKDLEYLQQMYPKDVKHCQNRIAEVLDKADYEGSMIYDEYPGWRTPSMRCLKMKKKIPPQRI